MPFGAGQPLPPWESLLVADSYYVNLHRCEMVCPDHLPGDALVDADLTDPEMQGVFSGHPERFWDSGEMVHSVTRGDDGQDEPVHCFRRGCWRLLPCPLTRAGETYVQDRHFSDPSVLTETWMKHYGLGLTGTGT